LVTALVVMAPVLFALTALAALVPASEAPNMEYYSVGSKDSQSGMPVSERAAVPQMSKQEALDAYGKLPLSFIPNVGQTDEAVRYYAQGAGYGFFFTKDGLRSPSPTVKRVVDTRWPSTSWRPTPTLRSQLKSGLLARSTTWLETTWPTSSRGCPRRAPLRGALARDRHGRAGGGRQAQVRVSLQARLIGW
jgi:hypothetical protein